MLNRFIENIKTHWKGVGSLVLFIILSVILFIVNPARFEEVMREANLKMAEETIPALITVEGEEQIVDVPTVETIDAGRADECPEDEECGQGAFWPVPVDTPLAFKNAVHGQCINTDGAFGSQCWDEADIFWQNYVGRRFNTCGTGAAKGTIGDGCWQKNAGSEFTMIWDKTKLQAGDWVVFSNGQWGHVGMAMGGFNEGYVALLGTNQGGEKCDGGGSKSNIINKSLGDFIGAFRPNSYLIPEPAPEPEPEPVAEVEEYIVRKGDTLGGIILKQGWWPNVKGLYGDDGYAQGVANYNGIKNRGLIYPNQVIRKAE